jgi:hypothetical protein
VKAPTVSPFFDCNRNPNSRANRQARAQRGGRGRLAVTDGVGVCAKAIVTGGVTLKSHSVLSLACIATKDLDSNYIYGNFPLEKLKPRIIS